MGLKGTIEVRRVRPEKCGELVDKTVFINRVAKVVKGGRRFSFSALVATGDAKGHIGFGLGKSAEVPDAIRKGTEKARKNLVRVPLKGTTIPHDVHGKFGPSVVILKPAAPGTGVIAGSVVRALCEVIGIKDIRTKCIGSSNPQYVLQACLEGLLALRDPETVASVRKMTVDDIGYTAY
jgi:small subunit ribosomal protein S5